MLVLAAYEGEELIGIIRTVGDGATIVFIQDILVYPNKQRHGVGTALVKRRPRTAPLSAHANLYLLKASGAYVIHMRLVGGFPKPLKSDFQSDCCIFDEGK